MHVDLYIMVPLSVLQVEFSLDVPGGNGKTLLINTLSATILSRNKRALAKTCKWVCCITAV